MFVPKVFSFQVPKWELVPDLVASYMESELSRRISLSVTFVVVGRGKREESSQEVSYGYYLITLTPTLQGFSDLLEKSLQDGLLKDFSEYSLMR